MSSSPEALATIAVEEDRSRRDARHDRLFRWLLMACALLVLASLLGAAGATLWGGRDAFATFGWRFLASTAWDPEQRRLRRAGPGLRHHRHLADRTDHRRAGELRHRAVSFRSRAAVACARRSPRRSNCWPASRRSSTACGAFSSSPRSFPRTSSPGSPATWATARMTARCRGWPRTCRSSASCSPAAIRSVPAS